MLDLNLEELKAILLCVRNAEIRVSGTGNLMGFVTIITKLENAITTLTEPQTGSVQTTETVEAIEKIQNALLEDANSTSGNLLESQPTVPTEVPQQ